MENFSKCQNKGHPIMHDMNKSDSCFNLLRFRPSENKINDQYFTYKNEVIMSSKIIGLDVYHIVLHFCRK